MAFITKYNFKRIHANPETIGKGLMMENCEELLYSHKKLIGSAIWKQLVYSYAKSYCWNRATLYLPK